MKLTKEIILNHIRRSNAYLWSLFLISNYKKTHILSFKGDGITESDTAENKSEKSINRLLTILNDFPSDAIFAIELKSSNTANGNGIIGPLEFVNHTKEEQEELKGIAQIQQQVMPAGVVSEEFLNGKIAELKAENTKALGELMLNYERKEFNNEKARTLQKLQDKEKELEDAKKKYDSNTGAAAEALFLALKKFFNVFTKNEMPTQALAAPEPQAPQSEEEKRKTDITEKVATFLYDNYSEQEIKDFYKHITTVGNNAKEISKTNANN